jgi:signal transduction histidine kinase
MPAPPAANIVGRVMMTQSLRSRRGQALLAAALVIALLGSAVGAIALSWSWEVWLLWSVVVNLAVGLAAASLPLIGSIVGAVVAVAAQVVAAMASRSFNDPLLPGPPSGPEPEAIAGFASRAGAVAWRGGRVLRERQEHAEALRASAAAEAVAGERLRIARDLHDMVAHSVGVIAIQAGVGRRVVDSRPDAARAALGVIETTSRETLASLRRTVASLRDASAGRDLSPTAPSSAPGLADVDRLATSALAAGVRVEVVGAGDSRSLPAEVELAAYRIIQEALTNVVRHSGADGCRVAVEHRAGELIIDVTDTGRGGDPRPGGFGITGMRERAALLGGELTAGPRAEGGFQVHARLPLQAEPR